MTSYHPERDREPTRIHDRQPVLRITVPGLPDQCSSCKCDISGALLALTGVRMVAVCPACRVVIGPVWLAPPPPEPAAAACPGCGSVERGVRVTDRGGLCADAWHDVPVSRFTDWEGPVP